MENLLIQNLSDSPETVEALEERDRIELELNRRICKKSLFGTLQYFWDTIIPDPYIHNWHIEYLCNEMQKVGQWVINREPAQYDLIINVPPGSTKSTICSIMFHVWLWINDPTIRMITASHSSALATEHAVKSRDVFKSPKFQELFPHKVIFKGDQDNKQFYQNIKNGSRAIATPGQSPVGKHGHLIMWDDLIDPEKAYSDLIREKVVKWMRESLSTRKIDKKNTPTVGIMQRLHEEDPTGYLLLKAEKSGKKIKHICLPATDELEPCNIRPKKLRMLYKGGLLDPIRLDSLVLNDMQIDLGTNGFAGQALQSPMAPGGNIIQRDWIKTYTELPAKDPISIIQSWDTAFKKGDENAYNVCSTWHEHEHGYFLDDVFCEKMTYPELKKQVIAEDAAHNPHQTLVEDKATGTPLMQELENDTRINFVKILPDIDKVARAHAASPTFEAGNVYIRGNAPWTKLVIDQLILFPNCRIKDIMDSISQYINYIKQHTSGSLKNMRGGKTSTLTKGYYHG